MQDCGHRKRMFANIQWLQVNVEGCSPCSGCQIESDIGSMLDDEGYSGSFHNTWKFIKGSLIVARAQKQNTLYVMQARLRRDEANVVADSYDELWHKSHGHMSERELHIVAEKDLLPYVKGINLEKCVDCLARKQNRAEFTLGRQTTTGR